MKEQNLADAGEVVQINIQEDGQKQQKYICNENLQSATAIGVVPAKDGVAILETHTSVCGAQMHTHLFIYVRGHFILQDISVYIVSLDFHN